MQYCVNKARKFKGEQLVMSLQMYGRHLFMSSSDREYNQGKWLDVWRVTVNMFMQFLRKKSVTMALCCKHVR